MTDRKPLVPMPEAERVAKLAEAGRGPDLLPLNLTPEERLAAQNPGLPMEPRMDPTAPTSLSTGFKSSEGKLAIVAFILGSILEGVAIPLLERLAVSAPQLAWVPVVLVVLGVVLQIAVFLGYQKGRTALKLGAPK